MLRDRTDRAWFSCLLGHLARKWGGSVLSTMEPARRPVLVELLIIIQFSQHDMTTFGKVTWARGAFLWGRPRHCFKGWDPGIHNGHFLSLDWGRRPSQPCNRWLSPVRLDSGTLSVDLWRHAIWHGRGIGVAQQPSPAMRLRRWWWWRWYEDRQCKGKGKVCHTPTGT